MAALVGSSSAVAQTSVVSVAQRNPLLFGDAGGIIWSGAERTERTYVTPRSARVNFYTNIERSITAPTESSVFIDIDAREKHPLPATKLDDVCIICMENFAKRPACRLACGCRLQYHEACILKWLHTGNSCPQCRKIINPELEVVRRAARREIRGDAHTPRGHENNDDEDESESLWNSTISTITTAGPTTWIFIVLIAFIVRS